MRRAALIAALLAVGFVGSTVAWAQTGGAPVAPATSSFGAPYPFALPANTMLGNASNSNAAPGNVTLTGCAGSANALTYTAGTGFGCGSGYLTGSGSANQLAEFTGTNAVAGITTGTGVVTALGNAANATNGVGTIGTSGSHVGLLSAANTWSASQTWSSVQSFPDTSGVGVGAGVARLYINGGAVSASAGPQLQFQSAGVVSAYLGPDATIRGTGTSADFDIYSVNNFRYYNNGTLKGDFGATTANTWTLAAGINFPGIANAAGNEILCYGTTGGPVTYESAVAGCVPSALRFKHLDNFVSSDEAAQRLGALRPAVWHYKDTATWGARPYVGLLADDVAKMDARCVDYDKSGKLENYEDRCVIAYLVGAVQRQQKEIADLRAAQRHRAERAE